MTGYFAALAARSGIPSGGRGPRVGDSGPSGAFAGEEIAQAGPVEENVEVVAPPAARESGPPYIRELEPTWDGTVDVSGPSTAAMEAMERAEAAELTPPDRPRDAIAPKARETIVDRTVEVAPARPAFSESRVTPQDGVASAETFAEIHEQREVDVGPGPAVNPAEQEAGGEFGRSRVWLETFHTVREWVAGTPGEPEREAEEVRTAWPEPSAETGRPLPERALRGSIVERFEERAAPPEVRVSVGTISIVVEEPQASLPPTRETRRPIEKQSSPPADWTRLRRRYIR